MMKPLSPVAKNTALHKRGVLWVNNQMQKAGLNVLLAPKDQHDLKRKDTDLIVKGISSGNRYEVRVPTTERTDIVSIPNIGSGLTWMLNEGNMADSDPLFYYCFTILDRDESNPKHRVFVVPSEVVVMYLKSIERYREEKNLPFDKHFLAFFLGTKEKPYSPSVDIFFEEDFENNWGLFK